MARPSKRTALLEHGLDLLHRQGFAAVGVAAIAAAGGAPKGSFYNHFRSKDAFGGAVLDRYFQDVRAALAETLGNGKEPALSRLRGYFVRLRDLGRRDGFARGCLIGNISAEVSGLSESTRANLGRLLAEWTDLLAACVADGQRDGSIRSGIAPARLAGLLLDAWQGALLRAKVERRAAALDDFLDDLLPQLAGTAGNAPPAGRSRRAARAGRPVRP